MSAAPSTERRSQAATNPIPATPLSCVAARASSQCNGSLVKAAHTVGDGSLGHVAKDGCDGIRGGGVLFIQDLHVACCSREKQGPAPLTLDALTEKERQDWNSAIDEYEAKLAPHDLLFDEDLVLMNDRLAEMGDEETAEATGFRSGVIAALAKAAPIYRAHWWPGDDHTNRAWIDAVAPLVEQLGAQISRELSSIYHSPWPKGAIHVDVCVYAGVFGGYTTLDPLHITVSSRDARNQGLAAFEMLFHEASHGLADPVRTALDREFQAQEKPIPRDLWHALLFYTTGEVVRRMMAGAGHESYRPYAEQNHLYERDWQTYQKALDRDWGPYLENRSDFPTAIKRLANDL